MDDFRKTQEDLEEENRQLSRKMLNLSSHDEMLQDKSKSLEDRISAVQMRYEDRIKSNEVEIQKLKKESVTYKHQNELLQAELADFEFRVGRSEHNEKILQERLTNTNVDYAALLSKVDVYDTKIASLRDEIRTLSVEKEDAEDLVNK
jgi:chromosome segregation ATPase